MQLLGTKLLCVLFEDPVQPLQEDGFAAAEAFV